MCFFSFFALIIWCGRACVDDTFKVVAFNRIRVLHKPLVELNESKPAVKDSAPEYTNSLVDS